MNGSSSGTWARVAVGSGLTAGILYPVLLLVPMPAAATAFLGCLFGLALGVASVGLYRVLALHRPTVTAQIGAGCNAIGGAVFSLMVLAQLSVNSSMRTWLEEQDEEATREVLGLVWQTVDRVQLGIDVAWDFWIGAGTALLAWSMLRHPRFGRVFGVTGLAIGAGLLALNFYTFPLPPAQSGLVDIGPAMGLWYLAVTVQVARSLGWVERAGSGARS